MSRHQACVSCGSSTRRAKLISCLHAVCAPCLEQHVQYDGSIKCPKCLAQTPSPSLWCPPLLSLPNAPDGEAESGRRGGEVITCDDCVDTKPAVVRCADCKLHLCEAHASGHPLSRATYNHQLTRLTDGEQQGAAPQQPLTPHRCALHPSQLLAQFCMQCSQLLCQRCVDTGSHIHSQHEILPIHEAAVKMRETVARNVHSWVSDSDEVIAHAMGNVKVAIQTLHDDAEAASQRIADYFKSLKAAVEAREQTLLDEVDLCRNKPLILLENQIARLEEGVFHGQTVPDLLESCHDDDDFLRMWKWLNTAIDKRKDLVRNDAEPCTASSVVFSGSNVQNTIEQVGQVGAVYAFPDIVVDGKVRVSEDTAYTKTDLTVAVDNNMIGTVVQEHIDQIQVLVSDQHNKALRIPALQRHSSGRLAATVRLLVAGEHRVSVMFGEKHLIGSPLRVNVQHCKPVFDKSRCHGDIRISNRKRTIHKTADGQAKAVCSKPIPVTYGHSQLRVRLDVTKDGDCHICASSSRAPRLDAVHDNTEIFGWNGRWERGPLGQRCKSGDVICLTLDHDKHTLTGLHERTGATEVRENVTGCLCWYVTLFYDGDQATIL